MMYNVDTTQQSTGFFDRNPIWLKACLCVMFLSAALIRWDEIKAPGHLIEREYNSAIFARAFYIEEIESVETWRKNNAIATRETLPLLEPPLTEYLVSLIYRVVGREEISYARYLTGLFWLVGGLFMYKITRMLTSVDAALLADGLPLEYYGEFSGIPWPVSIDDPFYRHPGERALSVQERIDSLGFTPDYFVITQFDHLYRKHRDLKTYLEASCIPLVQTDQYLVYGSCTNAEWAEIHSRAVRKE